MCKIVKNLENTHALSEHTSPLSLQWNCNLLNETLTAISVTGSTSFEPWSGIQLSRAVLSNVFIYWGASDGCGGTAPCGDCNNNNNNKIILIVILIKIITDKNLRCRRFLQWKWKGWGWGGSRMGTKENKIAKAGRPCSWECYEKKWNILLFRHIFFLKFWLKSKPPGWNRAPGKHITGAALDRPYLEVSRSPLKRMPENTVKEATATTYQFTVHHKLITSFTPGSDAHFKLLYWVKGKVVPVLN
jgi:hypothetical protein